METEEQKNRMEDPESLEQLFAGLEDVIGHLEQENLSLEKSFELYNQGMTLLKKCNQSIDEVEKKVLILDEEGDTHEF